jgi:hypothetical protein
MERVISVAGGNNLVIQDRVDNNKRQIWIFDQASKTIKSMHDQKRSMDARSGSIYSQVTDSRWY